MAIQGTPRPLARLTRHISREHFTRFSQEALENPIMLRRIQAILGNGDAARRQHTAAVTPQDLTLPAELYHATLEQMSDGVLVANIQTPGQPILYVNRAFEAITGYGSGEVLGKNCRYLQGSDRLQPEITAIREAIAEGRPCSVTLRNYRRDGTMFRNHLRLFPCAGQAGTANYYVGLIRDVTNAQGVDRLTGMGDRYGFLDQLNSIAVEQSGSLLVVKMDIVGFHEINSAFGYDIGDAVLCAVAQRVQQLRPAAAGRTGSNEFACAFIVEHDNAASALIQSVQAVMAPRYVLPGSNADIRFAMGCVTGKVGADPLVLLRQAGTALHKSKLNPAAPCSFDGADERKARNRIRIAGELQRAVAEEELLFHYQPQIDLNSGALIGAEALLRWDHGAFGLQPPGRFLPLAEETGLILEIGAWGLRSVARFAAATNYGRTNPLKFSFNVSVAEFRTQNMVALVERVLMESRCKAEWLTLELTENLMVERPFEMREAFRRLREMGVGLSIDDFGTGYSNLRYLESFPISEIKVDRSFVHDIAHNSSRRIIAESVIKLGAELGISVIAEGIETESERAIVRAMGCPVGQGHFFSRPLEEKAFTRLVEEGVIVQNRWDASRYLSLAMDTKLSE